MRYEICEKDANCFYHLHIEGIMNQALVLCSIRGMTNDIAVSRVLFGMKNAHAWHGFSTGLFTLSWNKCERNTNIKSSGAHLSGTFCLR